MFVAELLSSTRSEAGNMIDMVKSRVEQLADAVSESVAHLEQKANGDRDDMKPRIPHKKDMEGDRSLLGSAILEVNDICGDSNRKSDYEM